MDSFTSLDCVAVTNVVFGTSVQCNPFPLGKEVVLGGQFACRGENARKRRS